MGGSESEHKLVCVCLCMSFCSPGTVSEVLTKVPSGGALSPTTLGSWMLGGGGYTGGLGSCSWSSFFGTSKRRIGGAKKGGRGSGNEGMREETERKRTIRLG